MQATLEILPESAGTQPIGALITSDLRRLPFSGWIELAAAVEAWRHSDQPRSTTEPSDRWTR